MTQEERRQEALEKIRVALGILSGRILNPGPDDLKAMGFWTETWGYGTPNHEQLLKAAEEALYNAFDALFPDSMFS